MPTWFPGSSAQHSEDGQPALLSAGADGSGSCSGHRDPLGGIVTELWAARNQLRDRAAAFTGSGASLEQPKTGRG